MSDSYQTVILTLTDGRKVVYVGASQVLDDKVRIESIAFTHPQPLPHGCKLEKISSNDTAPTK